MFVGRWRPKNCAKVDLAPDLARLVPAWRDALSRKDGAGCSAPTLASKTTIESSLASSRSSPWTASQNRDFTRSPYQTNVMTEDSLGLDGQRIPELKLRAAQVIAHSREDRGTLLAFS